MKKNSKRILTVTIKRMIDDSPDTSHLGDYGNSADNAFSIDRRHDVECESQIFNDSGYEILNRIIEYVDQDANDSDTLDILFNAQKEFEDDGCTCGRRGYDSREYRYFNPNYENYTGLDREEILKYCIQDYERMESLNNGNWYYIGITAEAQITLGDSKIVQTIHSGGLWGIESDSEESYFAEVEQEELGNLREQLYSLGFSKRAISAAFKNAERKDA